MRLRTSIPIDKTLKEVFDEIAPKIINFNIDNHWVDDNKIDIYHAITSKYELDNEEIKELDELLFKL